MILLRAFAISPAASAVAEAATSIDHLDALVVEHVAGDVGGKVGLVEMIGGDDLDLAAEHLAAKILRRHLRRGLAAGAGDVGVEARTCRGCRRASAAACPAPAPHVALTAPAQQAKMPDKNAFIEKTSLDAPALMAA